MAEKEPLKTAPKETSGETPLRIRRGRVDSVDLYEIKDTELELLQRGSPAGIYLNFSIFLLSMALTALAALCTATAFKDEPIRTVFIVVTVIGLIFGALLMILWHTGRRNVSEVIRGIRDRIPPESSSLHPASPTSETTAEEEQQPKEPNG